MQMMFYDYMQNFSNVSTFSVGIAVIAVLLGILFYFIRDQGLPPGPTGVPILGIYPFLDHDKCYLQLDEFTKKYGRFFSFRVAGQLYVSLGSPELIREIHVTKADVFSNRHTGFNLFTSEFSGGVAFINGEPWKMLRKSFLQSFRDFGMISMRDNLSGPMYDILNSTINELRALNGKPVDIVDLLMGKSMNVQRRTLFGHYPITEQQIQDIIEPYKIVLEAQGGSNSLLVGSMGKNLVFRRLPCYHAFVSSQKLMEDALSKIIDEHERTLDEDNIRDVMDAYLRERNEQQRKGDPTAKYFTRQALMSSFAQFVGDGLVPIVYAVGVCFHALTQYPEEQEKIYKEILEVVGQDRQPSMEDKSKLSYTNAFIFEVFRTSDFFPFFPSLMNTKEVNVQGYRIPKGTIAVINMWSAHHDPEAYEEPYKFNPSRYISKPGKKKEELPFIFGIGKRSCIGEAFTMMQVFLFLTSIIKHFRITLPEREETSKSVFSLKLKVHANPR